MLPHLFTAKKEDSTLLKDVSTYSNVFQIKPLECVIIIKVKGISHFTSYFSFELKLYIG